MIAIYARVSTEEQAKSGYSLQDQIRECKRKAGTDNVKEYVDEGISGETLERPALRKLRQDLRDRIIDKVICLAPDRLSRNATNANLLLKEILRRGATIEFVNATFENTPMGLFNFHILAAVAELEKATITERMSRGRREKARQGKVIRNYQIYGYDYNQETEQLVINEQEAAVVRMIFDLFTKPNEIAQGMNGIAKHLTAKGIPTKKRAREWHKEVIRQILQNRTYIGEFYQNRWNTEGMLANKFADTDEKFRMTERPREEWIMVPCPAIIDREQFEYAQKLLQESRRRWNGAERHEYLLSGLLRCADCGNTMTGRKSKNWGKYVYEYTDVKNLAGAKNKGCGHKVKCSDLDEAVWNTILNWMKAPAEVAAALDTDEQLGSFEKAELERIDKEIERCKKGQQKLFNLLLSDDGILEDDIREKLQELKTQEYSLLEQKSELEEVLTNYQQNEFSVNLLQEAAEHYLTKSPEELTFAEKKELIRLIVREIRVSKDGTMNIYTF